MEHLEIKITANSTDTAGLVIALEQIVNHLSSGKTTGQFSIGESQSESCCFEVNTISPAWHRQT